MTCGKSWFFTYNAKIKDTYPGFGKTQLHWNCGGPPISHHYLKFPIQVGESIKNITISEKPGG